MQIAKRRAEHVAKNPDVEVISLGIGDTTEPLTPTIAKAMADAAAGMGTREGYSGCARFSSDHAANGPQTSSVRVHAIRSIHYTTNCMYHGSLNQHSLARFSSTQLLFRAAVVVPAFRPIAHRSMSRRQ